MQGTYSLVLVAAGIEFAEWDEPSIGLEMLRKRRCRSRISEIWIGLFVRNMLQPEK
jgi:hypothetical protein